MRESWAKSDFREKNFSSTYDGGRQDGSFEVQKHVHGNYGV